MNIPTKGKGEKSHEKYEKNCSTGYVCCHGSRDAEAAVILPAATAREVPNPVTK